jgi:uncharacterized membrane protein
MAGQGKLAYEVRAGLEVVENKELEVEETGILDEIRFRKPIRQHVKEFAGLFALIFLIVAALLINKGRHPVVAVVLLLGSGILLYLGYKLPRILYPVWKGWMAFAHYLGIVATFIIVSIAWFVVTVPLALIMKVVKQEVMDLRFAADVDSYWEKREEGQEDFKLLERQF